MRAQFPSVFADGVGMTHLVDRLTEKPRRNTDAGSSPWLFHRCCSCEILKLFMAMATGQALYVHIMFGDHDQFLSSRESLKEGETQQQKFHFQC